MADNKNYELDDEALAGAAGGINNENTVQPRFNVGDVVKFRVDNGSGQGELRVGTISKVENFDEVWGYSYRVDSWDSSLSENRLTPA